MVSAPTGTDVAHYAGDDASEAGPYSEVLPTVTAYVRSWTRGRGFDSSGNPAPDIAAVITTASAREVNLRSSLGLQREEIGSYSSYLGPSPDSFSLREQKVLNDYRTRAC